MNITPEQMARNAEIMFGTGSRQHLKALAAVAKASKK